MKRYPYLLLALLILVVLQSACVKRKLYLAEVLAREGVEGQVSALAKELYDRKQEAAAHVKEIGELNRRLGALQKELSDLQSQIARNTEMMGASTEKLLREKHELEVKLNATSKTLESTESQLQMLLGKQQIRSAQIASDFGALESMFSSMGGNVVLTANDDHLSIVVSDRLLFQPESSRLSSTSPVFLSGIAQFLSERPGYKVQIHAHVDNQLPPRQRDLTDSWAYAQARALSVTRALASSYNVNAYMLAPVARGEYQPISTNSTPQGRSENRRTVFFIYPDTQ